MRTDEQIAKRLGAAIGAEREARKWSQQTLADRLGTSKNYVGQLERGERSPSLAMLAEIALILDLSTDRILLTGSSVTSKRYVGEAMALFGTVAPEFRALALDFLRLVAQRRPEPKAKGKRQPRVVRSRAP